MLPIVPCAVLAQIVAPSQVTPKSVRPPSTNVPSTAAPASPEQEREAPPEVANLNITLKHVTIKGAFPEFESEARSFKAAIEGKRITVAKIYELANTLEEAYAKAGYFLVRVTVPPQKLEDGGTLRIAVIDGFIEKVDADKVPEQVREVVSRRMASLIGKHPIKLVETQRALLIAGDVPGLRLKSTLAQGETRGGVLVILDGTYHLATAMASIDNRLPSSLGTWSYSTNVALNSPFGFGELFYASRLSSTDLAEVSDWTARLGVLGVGAIVPLGTDGWTVNPEYTNSRSQPVPAGGLEDVGRFQRLSLRTSYPVIRTRTQVFTLTGAFEYIRQNIALPQTGTDLNKDRYGALRAGGAYESGLPWWDETLQVSGTFSHGTGGRDGAEAAASGIPLSRQGAGPLFAKLNLEARLIQPLPESFNLDLTGRVQYSFGKPVLVSEQLALDGPAGVSSYPFGTINVDEGAVLRGELGRPFSVQGDGNAPPMIITPYGFGAYGTGRLMDPLAAETALIRAGAIGVGVRGNVDMPDGYQGVSLGLEVARQYSDLPLLAHAWRGNFIMSIRF